MYLFNIFAMHYCVLRNHPQERVRLPLDPAWWLSKSRAIVNMKTKHIIFAEHHAAAG